jgi:putative addiction module component (TIGR02574 family)
MTREALEAQLLRLPADERAHLARVLIESLDDQPELDPSWLEEAQRRAAELRAGTVQPVPATKAFEEARRRVAG